MVEDLPEDSFIVRRNGKEYRAINADKAREIQKQKAEFEAAQKINAELGIQIREAHLQRDLALTQRDLERQKADSFKADFDRAREDGKRWEGLFISERDLRRESTQLIGRSSTPKGFMGKVLTFLDSPYSQAFWKLAVPTYQMVRCQ